MPTTSDRSPRLVRAACGALLALLCAGVAACGPAGSDDAIASETLDTSRLPRVAKAKQIYASPFSTVYTTTASVGEAAGSISKTMTAAGWKTYVAPFTDYAKGPDFQMMSFKRGAQALQVSISLAPAQGNATSVSYTGIVLANDLPVPGDATEIAFDPSRPYLSCFTAMPIPETLDYFAKELARMGFALWPGLAQQTANKKANGAGLKADHAYFVRDGHRPLRLEMHREDGAHTKIEIEAVSAEMLTAELAPDPATAASETLFRAKKAPDKMDVMIEDAMQQMANVILTAAGEAVANAGKPTAKAGASDKSKAPAMPDLLAELTEAADDGSKSAGTPAAPLEVELVAEDMDGFPMPQNRTFTHSGKTRYRIEREATVPAPLASVLAFYRRELPKRGMKETDMIVQGDMTVLKLATPTGQGALSLRPSADETAVSFIERRQAEAKKAGLLPKPGQAKLAFGSMAETPATVTIGTQTIKLAPGMGRGDKPDGPMLDLAPGTYAYSVAVPGSAPTKEEVVLAEGEAWALVVGPGGGAMPLHMY